MPHKVYIDAFTVYSIHIFIQFVGLSDQSIIGAVGRVIPIPD